MKLLDYFTDGWSANPAVLVALGLAAVLYARFVGRRGRPALFAAALALVALAYLSPLNLLARGVLFSAHMVQHIVLLLLVPALLVMSLPPRTSARSSRFGVSAPLALIGWSLGVGSMWLWHLPKLCSAAATNPVIHGVQTLSLIAMGAGFWWPILSPSSQDRLAPGLGIAYLFTACLACSGLGILLTLTTVEVCPAFTAPSSAPAMWTAFRDQFGARRDQQVGGLLMWVPMCLVYVAAIVLELARWHGDPRPTTATPSRATSSHRSA